MTTPVEEDEAQLLMRDMDDAVEVAWKKSGTEKPKLEAGNPMTLLLAKLDLWLMQQPEWVVIFGASRPMRREAARLVAKHLMTLPVRRG